MSPTKNNNAPSSPTSSYREVWWTSRRDLLECISQRTPEGGTTCAAHQVTSSSLCPCSAGLCCRGRSVTKAEVPQHLYRTGPGLCPCSTFQYPHAKGCAMGHTSGKFHETPTSISYHMQLSRAAGFSPCTTTATCSQEACAVLNPHTVPWSKAWRVHFSSLSTDTVISDGSSRGEVVH